ncbi:MAG: tetratricopeptide repeat protein [Micromonosporaceae bacterium]|nr:tetratricopeptide repeat protein [Micromonosporaceae bacterium]
MELRLLGPVEVVGDRGTITIGRRQERLLLAVLAAQAGTYLQIEHLADMLWPDRPPARAREAIQAMVSHLRSALRSLATDAPRVLVRGGGYALEVDSDRVDLHRFRALVEQARAAPATAQRAQLLSTALELWRGPVLADVIDDQERFRRFAHVNELHVSVREDLFECQLELGEHRDTVQQLTELVSQHPLREHAVSLLMLALYRCDRRAEALAAYADLAGRLRAELGLDPGEPVRRLHTAILRDAAWLCAPSRKPAGTPAPDAVTPPAQLPCPPVAFVGREEQLHQLDAILDNMARPQTVIVSAIDGIAGVGKTALAVRWGERVRARFRDGQLFLDLRGHSRAPSVRPIEALTYFLVALGVPPAQVPVDVEQAAAQYRTLVRDRQLLIVLDNASGADQVRPLLPGSPGSLVLVTSRNRLAGLVAKEGAHRLTLDVLSPEQSVSLLRQLLGATLVDSQPEATATLAECCGHLPLALRIAAANLLDEPQVPLTEQVARLRRSRLDRLAVGDDEDAAVGAAFDVSYDRLPAPTARAFRLLGLVPGTELDLAAAAALFGAAQAESQPLLSALRDGHLVRQEPDGRYGMHDLLRQYAARRGQATDPPAEREAAMQRLFQWYLAGAATAVDMLYPGTARLPQDAPEPAPFASREAALAWLETERSTMVSLIRLGSRSGIAASAVLADHLRMNFWVRRSPVEWLTAGQAAFSVAGNLDDPALLGSAHHSLGMVYQLTGRSPAAVAHHRRAARLYRLAGHSAGLAAVLSALGAVYGDLGQLERAARSLEHALSVHRRTGNVQGAAVAEANLGVLYAMTGQWTRSVHRLTGSLESHRRVGARASEAAVLANLSTVLLQLGRFDDAARMIETAIEVAQEVGMTGFECVALTTKTLLLCQRGEVRLAAECIARGLELAEKTSDRSLEAQALNAAGVVERLLNRQAEAVDRHTRARDLAHAAHLTQVEVQSLIGLALALLAGGRASEARSRAERAASLARAGGLRPEEGEALCVLADACRLTGETRQARDYAARAAAIAEELQHPIGTARAHLVLGHVTSGSAAIEHWQRALLTFAALRVPEAAAVRELLGAATAATG